MFVPPEATVQHSQDLDRADHAWLANLVRELFQTEESARQHPMLEAERLGEVPPADALRAVAAHARRTLAELPPLVRRHDLPVSNGGRRVGAAFSAIRDRFADLMLTAERSYRGTLLGMRHGVDLVLLIQSVARMEGDASLANWCDHWLERRRPLVEAAAQELAWFAANPARAREPARDNALAIGLQALVSGFEQLGARLRHVLPHRI
jgi:hypothetical protein